MERSSFVSGQQRMSRRSFEIMELEAISYKPQATRKKLEGGKTTEGTEPLREQRFRNKTSWLSQT
jgi:hypothetical protein